MKQILNKLKNISFGTNLWKNSKKEYFLGLTAHFFDDKLNYRSILYSFRKFKKAHYSSEIESFIKKQLGDGILEKVQKK
jgi:hypothetical protein